MKQRSPKTSHVAKDPIDHMPLMQNIRKLNELYAELDQILSFVNDPTGDDK